MLRPARPTAGAAHHTVTRQLASLGERSKSRRPSILPQRSQDSAERAAVRREHKRVINIPKWAALKLVLTGEYAYDNWTVTEDQDLMRSSIVSMTTSHGSLTQKRMSRFNIVGLPAVE